MISPDSRPVSYAAIVAIFSASFLLLATLLMVLVLVVRFDNPAMGLVIIFAAAGAAAHFWFSREKAVPSSARIWRVASICGAVSGALSMAVFVFGLMGDDPLQRDFGNAGGLTILAAFALVMIIQILIARLGFWFTFRQVEKQAAR